MIAHNIKFLRTYSGLSQTAFAKQFKITRGMVDSYERGKAKPAQETIIAIAEHYNITVDTLFKKNLQGNPGLLFANDTIKNVFSQKESDLIRAKDEVIKELRQHIKYLQNQNEVLNDLLGRKK